MKKLVQRFLNFPFFVQAIWLLCVFGTCLNSVLLVRDLAIDPVLWRLHFGFLILYGGQVVFILTQEKYVCLLTVLQGVLALLTTADFIFVPLMQVAGFVYHWVAEPTLQAQAVYQYVFEAAAFTLQMASAAYLWGYFYKKGEDE